MMQSVKLTGHWRATFTLLLVCLSFSLQLVAGPATSLAAGPDEATDPESVIRAIFEALNAGDVAEALALVDEDAVLVHIPPPPGEEPAMNKTDLEAWWTVFVERNGRKDITELYVHGDKVALSADISEDLFTDIGVAPMDGNIVAIVQGGLLQSFTITWTEASQHIFDVAFAEVLNKETIRRGYDEMWSQGNLDVADEIHAPDVIDRHTGDVGIDGIKEIVTLFRTAFPELSVTVEGQVADGDVVATEVTFEFGEYQGGLEDLMGIPESAIGTEVTGRGVDYARFKDGKIIETWGTHDDLGLFQQFGFDLTPPE